MKKRNNPCCSEVQSDSGVYRVESIVSVDDRGQMVLPKEVREKLGLNSGDKLLVAIMEKKGRACCAMLIKADELSMMMNSILEPDSDFLMDKKSTGAKGK